MSSRSVYIFTKDLRLSDNTLLHQVASNSNQCIFVYLHDTRLSWFCQRFSDSSNNSGNVTSQECIGLHKERFLFESLSSLNQSLKAFGQQLYITCDRSGKQLCELISYLGITTVYRSITAGSYEAKFKNNILACHSSLRWIEQDTQTLFSQSQLPYALESLPKHFTPFRKAVENIKYLPPLLAPKELPNQIPFEKNALINMGIETLSFDQKKTFKKAHMRFSSVGGEESGQQALKEYFNHCGAVLKYKQTRNEIDEPFSSTRLSPWLANGCISPRQYMQSLKQFEKEVHANDSTYWLYFELLWREFFYWSGLIKGDKLFRLSGIKDKKPLLSFYPYRFAIWSAGKTPSGLVNAIQKQLVETGWISNRARQISASYCINELKLDWRYGAAFFEKHLIDYDLCSNYGNWQYIAGVGSDPRGGRHFNIIKQEQMYDSDGRYQRSWNAVGSKLPLDNVDAADWPIDD